jgi:hypothetical protein
VSEPGGSENPVIVVPWSPGALIGLNPEKRPDRDELDELLDEVFGEPTREGPGAFDVAMLIGGAGLVVATEVAGLSNGLLVLGIAAIGMGLILPTRDLWQRLIRRRAGRQLQTSLAQGLPLSLGHPATQSLVSAYQQISAADLSTAFGLEALEVAHLAMIEVAGLLQGRLPSGAAEQEYVATRTRALTDLAKVMPRPLMDTSRAAATDSDELQARDAGVAAVRELEALTGGSSVARIDVLRSVLKRIDP